MIIGNRMYSALDSCREGEGSKLLLDHLGMNVKADLQENYAICIVSTEPFGHYYPTPGVFGEREEGNGCSHPSDIEGNGRIDGKMER